MRLRGFLWMGGGKEDLHLDLGWPMDSQGMPIIILFTFILSLPYSVSLMCYNPISLSIAIFPGYFF